MGSRRGGVDIEAVAAEDPSAIVTMPIGSGGEDNQALFSHLL